MAIEKENASAEDILSKAYALADEKAPNEQILELANKAEAAGDFRAAIQIREDILKDMESTKEIRKKSAAKDITQGFYYDAAETLFPDHGADDARLIAEKADVAGAFEDAASIYFNLVQDYPKGNAELNKLVEKKVAEKEYADAATVMETLHAEKPAIEGLADKAGADGKFADAVYILEEVLDNYGDKRREFRAKWAEQEMANGAFLEAAEIFYRMKDREGAKKAAEGAKAAGNLADAVLILEEILHEYNDETAALRKQMEEAIKKE